MVAATGAKWRVFQEVGGGVEYGAGGRLKEEKGVVVRGKTEIYVRMGSSEWLGRIWEWRKEIEEEF